MAGAGGLLVVLICALIAIALSLGTIFTAFYALTTRNARRGYKLGVAALIASAISIVLSTPFWLVVLRGKDTHGEPLRYPADWPMAALVVFEALLFAVALAGTVRQRSRR